MEEPDTEKREWHMGHIALFGALLMSHDIRGEQKEFLKKLMYEALTTKENEKNKKHV